MRHRRLLLVAVVAFAATTAFAGDLYWELPVLKAASGVSYSSSASNDLLLALSWQERTGSGASSAVSIWVDTARLDAPDTDTRWTGRRLVHGPIPLAGAGDEPRMHALALDGDRMLVVIVLPSTTGTEGSEVLVKSSEDAGATFRQVARFRAATIVTSPDLSRTADGGWLLLVTQPEAIVIEGTQTAQGKLSIAFSASSDGERWSELKPMVTEANLTQNIQPHHAVLGGADYVVFQSKRVTNHLYLKRSTDGGRTWDGPSIPLTSGDGFTEPVSGKVRTADEFNNQRPCLLPKGDRLGLAWERTLAGSVQAQIYYLEIDGEGRVLQPKEQVTRGGGALYPQLFELAADTRLLFAERQLGKAVQLKLAVRTVNGAIGQWSDVPVATTLPTSSLLSHGALLKDRLFVFAEALSGAGAWSLYVVRPDTSVAAPTLKPLDFSPATPANRTRVGVKWDEPADASRVSGYRYAWASDGAEVAAADLQGPSQQITLDAPEDGSWTLSVWSIDRAGNTSRQPARVSYVRDATPPGPVTLYLDPPPSPDGYLPYNDFTVWWTEPEADRNRIAGYELSTPIPVGGGSLTRQVGKQGGRLIVKNADNTPFGGAYTVKVAAVDLAGNFGPEVSIDIRLNRYKPVTRISSIDYEMDASDNLQVRLVGRGFTTGGSVAEIYLDQDATPPFDYTLRRDARQYEVPDDNDIRGITIGADYDSGTYYVGVRHTARGIEWGSQQVPYLAPGTVKVGDFSFRWLPRWASARTSRYHIPFVTLLIAACVGLVTVLFVVSSRRVLATAREGTMLRGEVLALIEGRPSLRTVEEAERRIRRLRRRGIGLRLKFSFLVSVLAIFIVVGLAVPLGMQMVKRERLILAEELKNRSSLLLDSVAERAVSPLRPGSSGVAIVSSIPASIDAMPGEALFLTVTGPSDPPAADPIDLDHIWATNDPSWPEGSFVPGRVQLADADLPRETVARFASELNAAVATTLADQLTDAARLKVESDRLLDASRAATATAEDVQAYEAMGLRYAETRNELRSQIRKLATQGDWSGSKPEFEPDRLQGQYLFYRPVAEYNEKGYFTLGMVRLRISTTKIQDQIDEVTRELVTLMLIISAAAVGAGIVGAVILAGITIRPIRPLVAGVAKIRDTEDQKELEEIPVKTRDEIGMLAEAVNEMVRDLVRAAKEREELLVGKSVQKRFLPLEEVGGEKGSTGGLKNDRVEIYGYYEGAKGVSGDYFDFQKLDDRYYAIINCDVAGKGVPAAMIMVEVATLFLGWCRDWTRRHDGRNGGLSGLVSTINDMLEERGFKGRFAQLTVGLYDVDTGLLTVCTAGNNVLHVYDADRGAILEHPLPPTLAAGTVPSMLVEAKGGYPQIALPLDRGDALFLFTDGFEESKRSFRTLAGDIVPCNEPGLKDDDPHLGTHLKGQTSEEFGIPRITGIVNAVFGRGSYRLERHHTASREDLEFDFRDCTGTVKDAVLALVCVEKVFRVYRDLLTDAGHRVHVEAKVDAFLRKHFRQYDALFGQRLEVGGPAGTVVYSRLEEDPQYDDLTLIVVRRPQGVVAR